MGHSRSASVEQDADRECNDRGGLAGTFRNHGGDLSESVAAIYRAACGDLSERVADQAPNPHTIVSGYWSDRIA